MYKIRTAIILLVVLILTGCALGPWWYQKPGVSQQQMYKDNYDCQRQATTQSDKATSLL